MRARVALALALFSLAGSSAPAFAQNADGRILVMPFDNVKRASRIVWLGEASAVLLADNLNALGANAIPREERQEALDRLQIPRTASLTDATVIRIGQLVGASQIIVGTLELDGENLVVNARAIALEAARVESSVTERGAVPELFAIFERLADRLAPQPRRPVAERVADHVSVAAFENYIKGLLAETPATAVGYLNAALRAQPRFDRARLGLWEVFDQQGEHEQALKAVQAVTSGSDLSRRARFMAGLSQVNLSRFDDAFTTFKSLADAGGTAAVFNNLGVIQLRRVSTPQTGMPVYYFNKAAEMDPTESDYFFNLGYAYWKARDMPAAAYWLREAVRRDPTDGDAHFILGSTLTATGNVTEANREKELARRLSSTYAEWEKRPGPDVVPTGLERIKSDVELPRAGGIEQTLAESGLRDQRELARFYLDRGNLMYEQEHDAEALTMLMRVLFLSPYEADAHVLIGRIHLRGGRPREAIDAFKIALWSAETPNAHAGLATAHADAGEPEAARAEAEKALALDPAQEEAKQVLERLDAK